LKGYDDLIRKATEHDIPAISAIYDRIHEAEAAGRLSTGWLKGVYPTEATARAALGEGELFVLEEDGAIVASARINRIQVPDYALIPWKYPARDDEVMVLHTLTVDPRRCGRGYGRAFLAFYEAYALDNGCPVLRIDTNAKNLAARTMYARHGYIESGVIPTVFNNIPGVNLVCMEKRLG
jgi:GNAT superfamily N-acetyltransferase